MQVRQQVRSGWVRPVEEQVAFQGLLLAVVVGD